MRQENPNESSCEESRKAIAGYRSEHQYIFRVYALDVDQIQPATNNKSGVMAAIDGHILGYGELIGLSSAG